MRAALLSFTALCTLSSSNCVSVVSRMMEVHEPSYFSGVRTDYAALTGESENNPTIAYVLIICDVPFSLIGDVLLLPLDTYDHWRTSQHPKKSAPPWRETKSLPSPKR